MAAGEMGILVQGGSSMHLWQALMAKAAQHSRCRAAVLRTGARYACMHDHMPCSVSMPQWPWPTPAPHRAGV